MLQARLFCALHSRPAFSATAVFRTAGFHSKASHSPSVSAFLNIRSGIQGQALRTNAFHTKASQNFKSNSNNNSNGFFRSGLLANSLKGSKPAFASPTVLLTLRRSVVTEAEVITPASKETAWKRLAISVAAVVGTVVGINALLNRETRDALSPVEKSYLHETFAYMGAGLTLTAATAWIMFKNGVAFRVMAANPWAVLGLSLFGGIGSMLGVFYTPPEATFTKHMFWIGFNVCQAATLSPLFFLNPALLTRAGLYTAGVLGSLSYVGATARNDKYLYLGGPLLAGITVVALSSLAPLALPLGMRGLAVAEAISLYGGLAVFSGMVLFDTQKILAHARAAEAGVVLRDPMRESIALELDFINIFIRIVQILAMQQGGNRRR